MLGSAARTFTLLGALSALAVTSAQAQGQGQGGPGRWSLELRTGVGMRANSGTSTSPLGVETKTGATGFLGGIAYARWFGDKLAGTLSAGVLSVAADVRSGAGGVETRAALVMPFFAGVRRYLARSEAARRTRFFGSVEVGPVMGYESATSVGSAVVARSITRTALGARTGLGVELLLGSRATLGVLGGYTFMTDFSDAIGGQRNHGGADFGLSFGLRFGNSVPASG